MAARTKIMRTSGFIFRNILFLVVAFVCLFSHAEGDLMQTPKTMRHTNPQLAIRVIENNRDILASHSDASFFESQWLLIELYLKTGDSMKAEETYEQLTRIFRENANYQPQLALIHGMLMLHNLDMENFLNRLAPFQTEFYSEPQTELNVWYTYLLGTYHVRKYQFTKALPQLTAALEGAKKLELAGLELSIRNQIVQLFYYTKQYERALSFSNENILVARAMGDQYREVAALSNNMNIYYARAVDIADSLASGNAKDNPQYQQDMAQSQAMQKKVLSIAEGIQDYRSMLRALIIQQSQYISQNSFQQAVETGKRILALASEHRLEYESAVASNNMAIAYRQLEQFEESILSLKAAETYYKKINSIQSLMWIYEDYALTYQMLENHEQALEYYKLFHDSSLKLINRTNNQTLMDLQEKYDAREKTQEISRLTQLAAVNSYQLKNEKTQRWLLMIVLSALLVIALLLYQKRKQLKLLLDKEAELNQKAIEVGETKQRFFNNLSHEFRTALTLSIGPLKSLLAHKNLPHREPVESALENNLHMMTLLNEVLDIEKIDANTMPVLVSEFNLSQAIDACVNRFQLQFKEKNIRLKKQSFEGHTTLFFDPSHFEKIISNILSNAGKYCVNGCTITLELENEDDHYVLSVKDDGPGISKSELAYVFNRFYQGKSSADKRLPGTGVGLSMVKELIELHEGSVSISSQEGEGCCVKLSFKKGCEHYSRELLSSFKKAQEDNSDNHSEQHELSKDLVTQLALSDVNKAAGNHTEAEPTQSKPVVLVVDDNKKIRQLIRGILQPDYHIVEAENGLEALKVAESIQPDLLIVDVMMPEMDGYQLTEQLKSNPQLAHLSIILLTALSETEQRVHGLLLGADDYVTKPFDNDELKARVKNHLAQKQRLSEVLLKEFQQSGGRELGNHSFEGQDAKRCKKLDNIITKNLSKYEFDVEQMYTALNMTRSSLYRYTQKIYGCSPMNLLKKRRLELAHQMLTECDGTISEVAYAVGYQSLSAFSRAFREHFDYPPTKVKEGRQKTQPVSDESSPVFASLD
ncbi:response regulator [Pleionea sp. CnH1-48]|uniref:response regulator n=1 Tax=Pleionea sp. CnH1-48 TaxID=2954494 RepID=UPI0020979476|nr:response regulator [Pleionea sp. CnH1-48]MCO7225581.1 response regulator [Pleionea sp. CnH1-48]